MKSKLLVFSLFLSFGLFSLSSCSSDSDGGSGNPTPVSRDVKYEVTGNATGNFQVTYFTATGSATNESFTSIPWSKQLTIQNNVPAITFNASVNGATPGQTITAKIYVGGVVKREGTSIVQSNGIAVIVLQSYVF